MSHSSMKRVIDLLSAGYRHEYDKRFETMDTG